MTYILIIAFAVLITEWQFRRDFGKGLGTAVFFLVLLPVEIRLEMPGALPQLTAHRVLLLQTAWHVLRSRTQQPAKAAIPFLGLLVFVGLARAVSTLGASEFGPGLKSFLSFLLETFLFCVLIIRSLQDRATVLRVLWGAVYALFIISVIAIIERQLGANLAALTIPGMLDFPNSVSATFRHRILLGYALAMGFPLVLALMGLVETKFQRRVVAVATLLLPAACYFSNSRGPWIGLALGGMVMAVAAGQAVRKRLIFVGVLTAAVLLLRPGVWDTIGSLMKHTVSTDTQKGRSASYRLELWKVAHKQLSKAPHRFLFGYGGQSLEYMDLGYEFEYGGSASSIGFTSWDSEYAGDLMQYGYLGFFAEIMLYLVVFFAAVRTWRDASPGNEALAAASLATIVTFLWAMTNVAVFNPQVTYLFWTVVAVSARWSSVSEAKPADSELALSSKNMPFAEARMGPSEIARFTLRSGDVV